MQEEAYWENLVKRSLCRFFLLAELARGPAHGYRINQAIQEACQGCCEPTEAMVYSTLKELTEGSYVEVTSETHGGRVRRVCHLTEAGFEAFRAAGSVWRKMLPQVQATAVMALSQPQELKLVGLTKGGVR